MSHSYIENSEVYIWFIAVIRILVLVIGAALSGMLVQFWWMFRATLRRNQKQGIIVLLCSTVNSVAFTLLVLNDAKPQFPDSLVAVGYLLFLVGLASLLFDPANRNGPTQ